MDLESFRQLPVEDVARIVDAEGLKVCVFPIDGTRRWFMLEYTPENGENNEIEYMNTAARQHIALYKMFFRHGVNTLLTPIIGGEQLGRSDEYVQMATEGLAWLANHPLFLEFYEEFGVRVRFYGEYRRRFAGTPYTWVVDRFDEITAKTLKNDRHRLLFGVFADDAVGTTAELAVRYYQEHGCPPGKKELIEMYYGENIPPVDMFIGFSQFCVFDMPLLNTGIEDLYFSVNPSLYFSEKQLRDVLYDHLYARREDHTDYSSLDESDWEMMRAFYRANQDRTLGIGRKQEHGGYWYPLPQVVLPPDFAPQ